jgi:hypothetical protein
MFIHSSTSSILVTIAGSDQHSIISRAAPARLPTILVFVNGVNWAASVGFTPRRPRLQ